MSRITEWKIQWFWWYTGFDCGFHHVIHSGSIGTLWFTLNRSIRTLSFDLNVLVSMQSLCGVVVPILCGNFVGKQCDMVPVVYILGQNPTPWLHRIHTHIEQRLHEFATDILSGLAFWGYQKVRKTESSKIAVSKTCHSACQTRFDSRHRVYPQWLRSSLQTKSPCYRIKCLGTVTSRTSKFGWAE